MDFASEPTRELVPDEPAARASALRLAIVAAPAAVLGLGSALVCYFAAGDLLGLFFGGVVAATVLAPPLVLAEQSLADRATVWGALVLSIALVWLAPVFERHELIGGWVSSVLVLASYSAATAGIGAVLNRIGVPAAAAAGVAVVIGMVWLSWPIWLCPWLTWDNRQTVLSWLIAPHPLLSINGALRGTYAVYWPHHKLAYQLSNVLNDIPYELPRNVVGCVLVHVGIAGAAVGIMCGLRRPRMDTNGHEASHR